MDLCSDGIAARGLRGEQKSCQFDAQGVGENDRLVDQDPLPPCFEVRYRCSSQGELLRYVGLRQPRLGSCCAHLMAQLRVERSLPVSCDH